MQTLLAAVLAQLSLRQGDAPVAQAIGLDRAFVPAGGLISEVAVTWSMGMGIGAGVSLDPRIDENGTASSVSGARATAGVIVNSYGKVGALLDLFLLAQK
jgi:hypothetical protein